MEECEDVIDEEIHIKDLVAEHLKQYDQIDVVAGDGDSAEACTVWTKPKMANFISRGKASKTLTLDVRIDVMDDEHLDELEEKIASIEEGDAS
jgi:hypothetical protein